LTLFLAMAGFGLTLPALPFFVERMALGVEPSPTRVAFHVGLLTSAYALSQVVLSPLLGRWSDQHGRRQFLLLGLVGFAVSQVAFGLGTSLPILYAARLAAGASAAAMLTISSAVVADVVDAKDRARGLAWTGTAASLGIVVGPAMSGILSRGDMHGHQMIGGLMLDGFSIPFLVAGGLALAAIPVVVLFLDETLVTPGGRHPPVGGSVGATSITEVLLLTGMAQMVLSAFEAIFALYGVAVLDLTIKQIGWGFVVCGGVMTLQGGIVSALAGVIRERGQIVLGFAGLAAGTASMGLATSFLAILGSIALLAFGMSLIAPNLAAAVARSRPGALGGALGIQNTAGGLGRVLGPAVGSLLFVASPRLPFFVNAALALAVAVVLVARKRGADGQSSQ